ncbi:uncharacterized protein PFL1_05619 [Pseudozyma flocculosa PF-1]|uniref:STEEP1 domain-containing protein n=2 Tax=Pseudozyma flocculosa TaxID=84751 RepID=A0A5C3FBG0_9BASI|nr:uncharacterized protein PFL1_05619 [Pseudozyma flocculosa PF-1]EPQ26983.1 hypothetical protein PFL1_05619 [Pseudozyma flocculosa PF-1]SPO40689.1 uncharacterized protein PSFLO_06171 [Pseudozyma flocculosa]
MPKVISRSTISASAGEGSASSALKVYYCLCGEFVLVCDRPLDQLPVRPLDGASVLRCLDSSAISETGAAQKVKKARVFKVSARQGRPKMIKREDGSIEKQYPFNCSRCDLEIGYEHTPPPLKSGGKFTFVLPGALTDRQGIPPPNVFLDQEEPKGDGADEAPGSLD